MSESFAMLADAVMDAPVLGLGDDGWFKKLTAPFFNPSITVDQPVALVPIFGVQLELKAPDEVVDAVKPMFSLLMKVFWAFLGILIFFGRN